MCFFFVVVFFPVSVKVWLLTFSVIDALIQLTLSQPFTRAAFTVRRCRCSALEGLCYCIHSVPANTLYTLEALVVSCQVCTEFNGLRDKRCVCVCESVCASLRALQMRKLLYVVHFKVYCILPCTLRRSKLKWGKKRHLCVCACVFKIMSVYECFFFFKLI